MKILISLALLLLFNSNPKSATEVEGIRMIFPEFTNGTVFFKNGSRIAAKLNYDTYEEQMIFKDQDEVMALANPSTIDRVEILDKVFFWLENDIFLEEVDSVDVTIYKRNRRELISKGKETSFGGVSQAGSVTSVNNIARGRDHRATELELKEDFKFKSDDLFYLKQDGTFRNIGMTKQVSKIFKVDKDVLDAFVKEQSIDFTQIGSIIQLIRYCKSLSN